MLKNIGPTLVGNSNNEQHTDPVLTQQAEAAEWQHTAHSGQLSEVCHIPDCDYSINSLCPQSLLAETVLTWDRFLSYRRLYSDLLMLDRQVNA